MIEAVSIKVLGKVQGVFFRASTKKKAQELGIKGWVRNESDGSVLIMAEANEEALTNFVKWCERGPEYAVVNDLIKDNIEVKNYDSFEIRR